MMKIACSTCLESFTPGCDISSTQWSVQYLNFKLGIPQLRPIIRKDSLFSKNLLKLLADVFGGMKRSIVHTFGSVQPSNLVT